MRVLICGWREYEDTQRIWDILDPFLPIEGLKIIQGGADGADYIAKEWAIMNYVPYTEYPANWGKYKKSAGPIRNQQMLDEGQPDLVIAFHGPERTDGRKSGTQDMVTRALTAGVEVIEIKYGE